MPETFPQWLWFAFFAGGSLGGWVAVVVTGKILFEEIQRLRRLRDRLR